jgi:hypothetical protein
MTQRSGPRIPILGESAFQQKGTLVTNRPYKPLDDGELYDALTPLPPHQDDGGSTPAAARRWDPHDRRRNLLCVVLMILLAGAIVVMI